jgi:hypothetical protein
MEDLAMEEVVLLDQDTKGMDLEEAYLEDLDLKVMVMDF